MSGGEGKGTVRGNLNSSFKWGLDNTVLLSTFKEHRRQVLLQAKLLFYG